METVSRRSFLGTDKNSANGLLYIQVFFFSRHHVSMFATNNKAFHWHQGCHIRSIFAGQRRIAVYIEASAVLNAKALFCTCYWKRKILTSLDIYLDFNGSVAWLFGEMPSWMLIWIPGFLITEQFPLYHEKRDNRDYIQTHLFCALPLQPWEMSFFYTYNPSTEALCVVNMGIDISWTLMRIYLSIRLLFTDMRVMTKNRICN